MAQAAELPLRARYYGADGAAGDPHELPQDPFDGVVHEDSVYSAINAYLANQRQGTASARNRAAVRGGGRKPWRQKGTGRARHGSIRSPIWRGGGVIFPPTPRSYRIDLPTKMRRLARRSALNARAIDERLIVAEKLSFDDGPKTRKLRQWLEKLGVFEGKVLILTAGYRREVYLSGRNLPNVEVRPWSEESVYDIVWADQVVIEEDALGESAEGATAAASDEASVEPEEVAPEADAEVVEEEEEEGENDA